MHGRLARRLVGPMNTRRLLGMAVLMVASSVSVVGLSSPIGATLSVPVQRVVAQHFFSGLAQTVDADGRWIVEATGSAADQQDVGIFMQDTATGASVPVPRPTVPNGVFANQPLPGFGDSPTISDDGRFLSYRLINSVVSPFFYDIFLFDRVLGTSQLVSTSLDSVNATSYGGLHVTTHLSDLSLGFGGDFFSFISGNGRYVLYLDRAHDAVAGTSANWFRFDAQTGAAVAADVDPTTGAALPSLLDRPAISPDGARVVWLLNRSDLGSGAVLVDFDQRRLQRIIDPVPCDFAAGCISVPLAVDPALARFVFSGHCTGFIVGDATRCDRADLFLYSPTTGEYRNLTATIPEYEFTVDDEFAHPFADSFGQVAFSRDGESVSFSWAQIRQYPYPTNCAERGFGEIDTYNIQDATLSTIWTERAALAFDGYCYPPFQMSPPPSDLWHGPLDPSPIVVDSGRKLLFVTDRPLVAADTDTDSDVYIAQLADATPHAFKYVALGDSFSAGEGIEPFFEPQNKCHRSELAYPTLVDEPRLSRSSIYQLHQAGTAGIQWGFQACSGATTDDVLATGQWGDPLPQLAVDRSVDTGNANDLPVDGTTDLVTISIGGDDVHFSDALKFCALSNDCTTENYKGTSLATYAQKQFALLSPKLDAVYSRIHAQAPHARILVLGYPQLFPSTVGEQACQKLAQRNVFVSDGKHLIQKSLGYTHAEESLIRTADDQLNQLISSRVAATGFASVTAQPGAITFVRTDSSFAHHEICGDAGEWINAPTFSLTSLKVNDQSFHPNALGQQAFASSINSRLNP